MRGEEWGEMREKQEEEKGRGRRDRRDERKQEGRKRPFLTPNNDTTIGLCFLFSAD